MKSKGFSSIFDILCFTLIISITCLLLLGATTTGEKKYTERCARRIAQNSLLILQKIPVEEFGKFSYRTNFVHNYTTDKRIQGKPISQLITEDALLNSEKQSKNDEIYLNINQKFSKNLDNFLKKELDRLVGKKFGYRLISEIISKNTRYGENTLYRKTIEDLDPSSEKFCSEKISLYVDYPDCLDKNHNPEMDEKENKKYPLYENSAIYPSRDLFTLTLKLELWSN